MREPWDNDEEIDYTVGVDHWTAGGGPRGVWPEHDRVGLFCSVCGRVQSQPPTTGLTELVIAAAAHHHEKHDGPPRMSPEDIEMQQLFEGHYTKRDPAD